MASKDVFVSSTTSRERILLVTPPLQAFRQRFSSTNKGESYGLSGRGIVDKMYRIHANSVARFLFLFCFFKFQSSATSAAPAAIRICNSRCGYLHGPKAPPQLFEFSPVFLSLCSEQCCGVYLMYYVAYIRLIDNLNVSGVFHPLNL